MNRLWKKKLRVGTAFILAICMIMGIVTISPIKIDAQISTNSVKKVKDLDLDVYLEDETLANNAIKSMQLLPYPSQNQVFDLGMSYSAAIDPEGDLYCWGRNNVGQIGNGTKTDQSTPVKVLSNVVSVDLEGYYSGAITSNGDLYCWGNIFEQYSADTEWVEDQITPIKMLDDVVFFDAGPWFHCGAITSNGDLYCWGANLYGQIGNGGTENQFTPVKVLSDVVSVRIGFENSAAITSNGDLYCWGHNNVGQIGNGTTKDQFTPVKVLSDVVSVELSATHNAAITSNGDLYCWGYSHYGEIGDGSQETRRTKPIKILSDVVSVKLGDHNTAAIVSNGDLYCWGRNQYGQIGNGTYTNQITPTKVFGNVVSVSEISFYTCVVTSSGDLYCWGRNQYGQIGNGDTNDQTIPVKVLNNVVSVKAHDHICAITSNGDLYCWGENNHGQVGNGTYVNQTTPIKILNIMISKPIPSEGVVTLTYRSDGTIGESYSGSKSVNTEHNFYYSDNFFYENSTRYNNSLAVLTLGLELTSFSSPKYDNKYKDKIDEKKRAENIIEAYNKLGFKNSKYYNYDRPLSDDLDKTAFSFAKKIISNGQSKDTLIAVVVRGGGYGAEWVSNFHVGNNGNAIGFDTAAKEILQKLKEYIKFTKIEGNLKLWITGYSRGGAVANILTHYINEDRSDVYFSLRENNIFAYTFATPSGYRKDDSNSINDDNLWNVVCANDIVPKLALARWGFSKYGNTRVLPEYSSAALKKNYQNLTGKDFDLSYANDAEVAITNVLYDVTGGTDIWCLDFENHVMSGLRAMNTKSIFDQAKFIMDVYQIIDNVIHTKVGVYKLIFTLSCIVGEELSYVLLADQEEPSILKVIMNIEKAHYPEHYLCWLEGGSNMLLKDNLYARLSQEGRDVIDDTVENLFNETYKRYTFFCPVDINVYDSDGILVASIIDNNVIVSELPCYVDGDKKVVYLIGEEDYKIEMIGNDIGTMDYIVNEYNNFSEVVRSVYYYDVPLKDGLTYIDIVKREILNKEENYSITDGEYVTIPAFDTLTGDMKKYGISVENGISLQSNAAKGESVSIISVMDEGYEFVKWISSEETDIFDDATAQSTRFRMPGNNVVIKAVWKKTNLVNSKNIYIDQALKILPTIESATLYSNGGNVKGNSELAKNGKRNYKQQEYYSSVVAPTYTYTNKKGKEITIKGKVVVGITTGSKQPTLVNGKIIDSTAKKMAKASYSAKTGKITVKVSANVSGDVYLWIMGYVKVNGVEQVSDTVGYIKLSIKAAPTSISTYAESVNDDNYKSLNKYKKDTVDITDSTLIYIYPSYKKDKKVTMTSDATYTATVDIKAKDYFSVEPDDNNAYCFKVTALKLRNGKKTTGKITIQCNQNGKKAVFSVTAVNSVKQIKIENVIGMESTVSGSALTITASETIKTSGTFSIVPMCLNKSSETTDSAKIYIMSKEDGFDLEKMKRGKVVITVKPTGEQKKIKMKMEKDKSTVIVTTSKGITGGTKVYCLIVYNTKEDNKSCGYKIVEINVVK